MSIEFVSGDMFATPDITVIGHGVNLQGAFGAGVAGQIARRYPWAKADYLRWFHRAVLGQVLLSSPLPRTDVRQDPVTHRIAHLATQGMPGPCADLWAIEKALLNLVQVMRPHYVLALPQIGCGIGGLEWDDVMPIVERVLEPAPFRTLVFEKFLAGEPAR